jgi:CelD/BcsL family acetyltransferase involved in cellulose biosynthesis
LTFPRVGLLSKVAVLDQLQDFATLEEEWEDLHRNAAFATPFQSWAWLYSWWEFYGEGYDLRLVTIRCDGLLVGLMPLMLQRRGGFGRLLFVGTGPTDYQDILAREGWESRVSEAGVRALRQMAGWQVADLQQLRPEAAAWGIFEGWAGPRTRIWQDNFPMVDVKPWDELLMTVGRKLRNTVRRTLRRAEADGVQCELAGADDAEQAARRLIGLHLEMFRGRDIAPEHLTERFQSHVVAVAGRLTVPGLGGIYEFWRDGEVIASHMLLFGRSFVGEYMFGTTQEARRRFQVSSLNMWNSVNVAQSKGSIRVSQLRGDESYKVPWASEIIPNYRMILGRRRVFWGPYAGYQALHSWSRRYASSEGAPSWIKKAANGYRTMRRRVTRNINS